MLLTPAPFIAVMDADLQHDEAVLPCMYQRIKSENLDLIVGSRNVEGGSMGAFAKERVMLEQPWETAQPHGREVRSLGPHERVLHRRPAFF